MLPPPLRQVPQPADGTINLMAPYMTEDKHGNIWLSTSNGLVRYDGHDLQVLHAPGYPHDDEYSRPVQTPDGRIWAGLTYINSTTKLVYVDTDQNRITIVSDTTRLVREFLAKSGFNHLYVDRRGQLWIMLADNGLLRVNPQTLAAEHVFDKKINVRDVTDGPDGRIWFTTAEGLYAFDPGTRKTWHYQHDADQPTSLGNNRTYVVRVRKNGDVLVSLPNEVDVLTPRTGQFRRILLPKPDPSKTLWTNAFLSDGLGADYFSVGRMVFRLTAGGELQRLEFTFPAEKVISLCLSQGKDRAHSRLWVNTITHQLSEYDLTRLRPVPSLNILDISVNGTRLAENEQKLETRFQRDTDGQPFLTVRENDFVQLRFVPFTEKQLSLFRYKLDGYDRQWATYRDSIGQATYQLPAGQYRFLFNHARAGGVWDKQIAEMTIRVQPPFWKTTWFLAIMLGLTVIGLFILYRIIVRRQKLRQELARKEGEAASLRQLDELKGRFFANITHELRTPITLLLNANEQLTRQPLDEQGRKQVVAVDRNANQLLRLITHLLDMARLDGGKLDLTFSLGNPVAFVEEIVKGFDELALTKHIRLSAQVSNEAGNYLFDKEKLEAILHNLLSNAMKFTPTGGHVQVTAQINETSQLLVTVQDTGPGISAAEQVRIFERFYQVDASSTRAYGGTGIGLAFVRELTELLDGTIQVNSTVDEGSTFTVVIPVETVGESASRLLWEPSPTELLKPTDESVPAIAPTDNPQKPVVLVVEDNEELRAYLVDQLTMTYQVITAVDGREGLDKALIVVPDLIVSDVMMPRMDGFALVGALKTDVRTSHIPVVLLTARSSHDSVLRGLDMGADAYVGKPFRIDELKLRIRNAIQTRRNWQTLLAKPPAPNALLESPNHEPVPDKEKRFLDRLRQVIQQHLQDEQVEVDWLADQANMSRSQLHRKLIALTGLSTTRFIHSVRLEKAAELLRTGEGNIAEIAYQVGYNSQSYFTKMFQEHFGHPPTALKVK